MTRRHFVIVGCAALVLLTPVMTVSLSAQGKWWTSEKYKQRLGLTAEQSQQCEQIFQAMAPKLRAAKASSIAGGALFRIAERSDSTKPKSRPIDSLRPLEAVLENSLAHALQNANCLDPRAASHARGDHQSSERPHSGSCTARKGLRRPGSR